jgi:ArsR family transcriptional regulator, arsenate/arsenite/antimonite-responsive transcriptional repressor
MFDIMSLIKALADETRVRLLAALEGRELCVCQLIELVDLAPSTVSKHLSILRSARLIEGRKDGRWMHYRLANVAQPEANRGADLAARGDPEQSPYPDGPRAPGTDCSERP